MHIDFPSHTIEQIKKNNTSDKVGLILSSSDNVAKENIYNLTSFMGKAPIFLSLGLPCARRSKQKINHTILNPLLDCNHSCIN